MPRRTVAPAKRPIQFVCNPPTGVEIPQQHLMRCHTFVYRFQLPKMPCLLRYGCVAALVALCLVTGSSTASRRITNGSDVGAPPLRLPAEVLYRQPVKAVCSAEGFRKQTCIFRNVCFLLHEQNKPGGWSVTVVQPRARTSSSRYHGREAGLLQKHLQKLVEGTLVQLHYDLSNSSLADSIIKSSTGNKAAAKSISVKIEDAVTLLWRVHGSNQESFGHAVITEAYPMFMSLSDQLSKDLPQNLQVLITPDRWEAHVLPHVLQGMVTPQLKLLLQYLSGLREHGKQGVCFRHLFMGDGGYVHAARESLAGHPLSRTYATGPSMYNNWNWWSFRRHAMQVAGVLPPARNKRPLVLLNDKRYHQPGTAVLQDDRRMILDIEQLANEIRAAYSNADVIPVRFRELSWPDQLRLLSASTVFITSQGSSAFRLVFLPHGATCIMVGSPELPGEAEYPSFHELDRWFPLTYVNFERYPVPYSNSSDEFVVWRKPGHWQPADEAAAERWWLYNAHVKAAPGKVEAHAGQSAAGMMSFCKSWIG